jgi:signal transduction histidine kinase
MNTLRGRLTLWYIISTIVILTLLASLFSVLLWYSLHNQIDHHLHIVTGQAQQIIDDFDGEEREKLLTNVVSFEGMSIVVISDDGEDLLQTNSDDVSKLKDSDLQQLLVAAKMYGHHPLHFTVNDMRFGVADVRYENKHALLAVGYSVSILRQTFYQMMAMTLGVMILTLVPFTFIGYKLLKKYLHPLEVVADVARQVTHPKQLSTRVTGLALTGEVKTIVSSFNTMLYRLEHIFQTEHEFFSQAAHTLKTPLAVLRAKVEGSTKESLTVKQNMQKIIDDAVDTIHDLLLISRIETGITGERKKVDVSVISKELVELAESLAHEKKVVIQSHIESPIYLLADPRLLKRSFGNIIHNALWYVNPEGIVKINLMKSGENVHFTVQNSGQGIAKSDISHVFERFYRGKNANDIPGSGLGLAITKAIAESLGGTVTIKSSLGKETSVDITLPLGD